MINLLVWVDDLKMSERDVKIKENISLVEQLPDEINDDVSKLMVKSLKQMLKTCLKVVKVLL